jgi:hypothetical protein
LEGCAWGRHGAPSERSRWPRRWLVSRRLLSRLNCTSRPPSKLPLASCRRQLSPLSSSWPRIWPTLRQAIREHEGVLLHQAPTEVDSQQPAKSSDLGPIGNATHQGSLLQTVLAILPGTREVVGIAKPEPFLRKPAPKGERRSQRSLRERESDVWPRRVQALGSPRAGVQWIHVADRSGDRFPLLTLCQQLHCAFVLRACRDRWVDAARWRTRRLGCLPVLIPNVAQSKSLLGGTSSRWGGLGRHRPLTTWSSRPARSLAIAVPTSA